MISVIVYGRNDSYGYNLAKRAAISINGIAQLLNMEHDEIIFVDFNTPNDIPTFPESIADTLTTRAKQVLRILRVRPEQYEKSRNGCKFSVLEPLCRNIAIRRTNPANRWILNTNTDMVFTPLANGESLSQIVSELPDGFYELPRFEMPESLWESCDRMNPERVIEQFRTWGLRFHIDEVVTGSPQVYYDAPGDFQLTLRSQLFHIHGFNEQMILGWHRDSNLCVRLWLLNGETKSLLHKLYGYHCDHTRIQSVYHMAGKSTENSLADFFLNVTTPYIPEQEFTWGMPEEVIEEIRLSESYTSRVPTILGQILPGMDKPLAGQSTVCGSDVGLYYDNFHVFTYLADIVVNFSPAAQIGYWGCNEPMLDLLTKLRQLLGHTGQVLYFEGLLTPSTAFRLCKPASRDEMHQKADSFIFDFSMKHLPSRLNAIGLQIPGLFKEVEQFARSITDEIIGVARFEHNIAQRGGISRLAIFVGCHCTIFDETVKNLFSCAMTPANTYVRNGIISSDAFNSPLPILPIHTFVLGEMSIDTISSWIFKHCGKKVSAYHIFLACTLYEKFMKTFNDRELLDIFEKLMSFDAGRGIIELQIEISKIDGAPELGELLHSYIREFEKLHH